MAEKDQVAVRDGSLADKAPGVHLWKDFNLPRRTLFTTGVPAFLGVMPSRENPKIIKNKPVMLTFWSHFGLHIGEPKPLWHLAHAVRGFFENGGRGCYVVVIDDKTDASLRTGLEAIEALDTIDLVCAPDLVSVSEREQAFELQQTLAKHCEKAGDRFAILDSRRGDSRDNVWDQWSAIDGKNGALYYPWIKVQDFDRQMVLVPPCGHIAGVYARTDRTRGVHKAPANEVLEGVVGLERPLTDEDQGYLNPKHVNCLRSFPGRGIRVWGARTLSGQPEWTYVNVRRLFLTAVRWINWNMRAVTFEPNDSRLWARIERELNSYFMEQYRAGALKGGTPQEAFYVKCDAETNSRETYELNQVVTEIGLAPTVPYEFVKVRLIHGPGGVSISGPTWP